MNFFYQKIKIILTNLSNIKKKITTKNKIIILVMTQCKQKIYEITSTKFGMLIRDNKNIFF